MGEAMKLFLIIIALTGSLFAQDQPQKPASKDKTPAAKKKTSKKTEAPASPFLTIPKEATANPDGTYAYTDKDGKKWSYWNSPFGVMRSEIKGDTAPPGNPSAAPMPQIQYTSTTDKGDTVRFERQTPFGPVGYDRKKSEMTDAERSLFETQHPESKQTKPE
jgi:hypothetical protein